MNFASHARRAGAGPIAAIILLVGLPGCVGSLDQSGVPVEYNYPKSESELRRERSGSITEGFALLGGGSSDTGAGAKIGVNALLWRASLDTVSFMPLASADPFGGVIITDWYSGPATPQERFKATVYILDSRLRADAVRVTLFRQVNRGGRWTDAEASAEAQRQLEDQILTRARQLRIARSEG